MDNFSRVRMLWRTMGMLVFIFARFLFMNLQEMVWTYNGTAKKVRASKEAKNYDRSAQVVNIVFTHDHYLGCNCTLENFIYTHERFENPRYIFDNENVTLVTVDSEYAVFGVAGNEERHLWKLEYGSFLKIAQLKYCRQLILVPLDHFHRMAEELGDPKNPIIFLLNTGRCGSTLMVHLMEKTEQCISLSEPCALDVFKRLTRSKMKPHQLEELCRDIVRWICRPYKSLDDPTYFIKVCPLNTAVLPLIKEAFPGSHFLFMYRDVVDFTKSCHRLTKESPLRFLIAFLAKRSIALKRLFERFVKFEMKESKHKADDWVSSSVDSYANSCNFYLNHRRNGLAFSAVRYEDLVKDSKYSMTQILDYCGLRSSESTVDRALEAMKEDSQKNSHLAKDKLKRHAVPEFTDESLQTANKILSANGLPIISKVGEPFILEGTITRRSS